LKYQKRNSEPEFRVPAAIETDIDIVIGTGFFVIEMKGVNRLGRKGNTTYDYDYDTDPNTDAVAGADINLIMSSQIPF
jgi:hypothetical protein